LCDGCRWPRVRSSVSMVTVSGSLTVQAPLEHVWEVATDPRLSTRWNPNVVDVRNVRGLPVARGTRWTQVVRVLGANTILEAEVVECEAPMRGVVQMKGRGNPRVTTTLEPESDGVRLTQEMAIDFGGTLGGLAGRVAKPQIEKELNEALRRQKAAAESSSRPG